MIIYLKVPKVSCKSIPGLNGSPTRPPPPMQSFIKKRMQKFKSFKALNESQKRVHSIKATFWYSKSPFSLSYCGMEVLKENSTEFGSRLKKKIEKKPK
jgi:hypothetical protein